MFSFLKNAINAVRLGDEYRRKTYGEPETFAESFAKAQAYRKWYNENLVPKTVSLLGKSYDERQAYYKGVATFKQRFGLWDGWTGGRYERETNPNPDDHTDPYAVCRSDPVLGDWFDLSTPKNRSPRP